MLFIALERSSGGRSRRKRGVWFWGGAADVHEIVVEALDLLGEFVHGGFGPVEGVAVLPHLVEVGVELEGRSVSVGL